MNKRCMSNILKAFIHFTDDEYKTYIPWVDGDFF